MGDGPAGEHEETASLVTAARFDVGHGYALYQGPSWDTGFHRHAAFQIVAAVQGEAALVDASGTRHRAVALVVPPMVRHRMPVTTELRVFFVEPRCSYADRLRERCGPGISAVPELRDLSEDDVRPAGARPSGELDPRLLAAMDELAGGPVTMPDLARRVEMSPQRLRGLARSQLGMPLARWRVWSQLRRAVEALREGRPLAEAAAAGGFADQAHLTRWMREMTGLTPAAVLPVLRARTGADAARAAPGT
ncbi:helix-turn-helix domain-containing protein [Nonomuraea pusilla]|uniref:helix-turn-helix domain-containing protein n=1 Tax=Nonomuraea pusilla TaxID=46177 RepID=UPI001F3FB9EC|nr:AraC family transcriptional regulator [Nonomuraea pusilla]